MSEFLVSKFQSPSAAHRASIALEKLRVRGVTIYAWAVVCKNSDNRISISDRREYPGKPATVAALIGGLAGFTAAGPFGALTGAAGGALVGVAAKSVNRDAQLKLLDTISHEIGRDNTVLITEAEPTDTGSLEALIHHCGGTIMPSRMEQSVLELPAH